MISLLFVILLGITEGFSQIPPLITYQGYVDSSNIPFTGNKAIRFKIYDAESGGNNLWTEDHSNVSVTDGYFQVQLGRFTPLNLDFDIPYWLGINIENEPELVPRTALTSSAYSFFSSNIRDSSVSIAKIQDDAVTLPKIEPDIMVKVYENSIPVTSLFTISGLDGNLHKMYKIYFHGTMDQGDKYLLIRPNGVATDYRGWQYYFGDATAGHNGTTWGMFIGRSWLGECDVSYELTLFCEPNRARFSHGQGMMWYIGDHRSLGLYSSCRWLNETDNIITLEILSTDSNGNPSGTFRGTITVYALKQ